MNTDTILDKIETHWASYLISKGKNPLRHAMRSHYMWYKSYMPLDPEIEQYFTRIETSAEYIQLSEKIKLLETLSLWVSQELSDCHHRLDNLLP